MNAATLTEEEVAIVLEALRALMNAEDIRLASAWSDERPIIDLYNRLAALDASTEVQR